MARAEYYRDPAAPRATVLGPSIFAVVRGDSGQILLVRRVDDGMWELPGGRVEIGESAVEAVTREVNEESGVTVKVVKVAGVYSDPSHVILNPDTGEVRQQFVVCVHALPIAGAPRPDGSETSEAAWIDVATLADLPMHPAMRRRIEHGVGKPDHPHVE
jgi:8-oxo-dGTP diphosphatase